MEFATRSSEDVVIWTAKTMLVVWQGILDIGCQGCALGKKIRAKLRETRAVTLLLLFHSSVVFQSPSLGFFRRFLLTGVFFKSSCSSRAPRVEPGFGEERGMLMQCLIFPRSTNSIELASEAHTPFDTQICLLRGKTTVQKTSVGELAYIHICQYDAIS